MKKNLIVLIFASLLVVVSGCNSADTSEPKMNSETKNDTSDPQITDLTIEKINDSNFYVVTTAAGNELNYAYYVFKDNEILERFPYQEDAHFSYSAKEPGTYKVRSYIKDQDGNVVREDTQEIEIN